MSAKAAPTPGSITAAAAALQKRIWDGSLPLEIRLSAADCRTYDDSDPYLITVPRLSYLPFLLPRLYAFFHHALIDPAATAPHEAWLSFDGLPLKWHYPVGLLHDLFTGSSPAGLSASDAAVAATSSTDTLRANTDDPDAEPNKALPWRLTAHYGAYPADLLFPLDGKGMVLHDAFVNAVKEADFVRNGTARTAMSLSRADSDALWDAVCTHRDLAAFERVNAKLCDPPGLQLRHVPLKVYLPVSVSTLEDGEGAVDKAASTAVEQEESSKDGNGGNNNPRPGTVRVVQGLVPPFTAARQATTLGSALNQLLPSVFPSRRNPVLAVPVLHGAVVPMAAALGELGRAASYADGFLHVVVVLLS